MSFWFYLASAALLLGRATKKSVLGIIVLNVVVTALKTATHVRRPNGLDYMSFPSGHAANAWYLAALWGFNPWVTMWAVVVSVMRVVKRWHTPLDVVAGALLGVFAAKHFLPGA